MRSKRILIVTAGIIAIIMFSSVVYAQTGDGFDLSWNVMGGGSAGGPLTGSGFSLRGTVSQTAINVSSGSDFVAKHGYWYGVTTIRRLYLPVTIKH